MSSDDLKTAVRVENLCKHYRLYRNKKARLLNGLSDRFRKSCREFHALNDISFTLEKGEVLGVLGENGSGKSTLLQLVAGILRPTKGIVSTVGKVAAMLELGSGINPKFTGRENIYVSGAISGFSKKEVDKRMDDIISFADIGDFIDQPVRIYSNGMFIRLAFAVQVCLEPDILLVDEVLSVGDLFFQQKCHKKIDEIIKNEISVIIVSHDTLVIEKFCDRAMVLQNGNMIYMGRPDIAVQKYLLSGKPGGRPPYNKSGATLADIPSQTINDWPDSTFFHDLKDAVYSGSTDLFRFNGVALLDKTGLPCSAFDVGSTAYFNYEFEVLKDIEMPVGAVMIVNRMNINMHCKTSVQLSVDAPPVTPKGTFLRFRQSIRLGIEPGSYSFMVVAASVSPLKYHANSELIDIVDMDLASRHNQLKVMRAGFFEVKLLSRGVNLPFFGLSDLEGACRLEVITQ